MSFTPTVQGVVDRYERSLRSVRGLFDLYPDPRPQGAPPKKYRPLPPAIVQGTTAGFESFAEDLLVVALIQGNASSWAQVAAHANMTNPTVKDLVDRLEHATGLRVATATGWSISLWKQSGTNKTAWSKTRKIGWDLLQREAESWMQVRHCLTHGLVSGTEPAIWPGPVSAKAHARQAVLPAAMDVLTESPKGAKKSLTLYAATNCCLIYTEAAATIAESVANHLGEAVDTSLLRKFETV